MKKRAFVLTLILLLSISIFTLGAQASYSPPEGFGAPKNVAVLFHGEEIEEFGYFRFSIGYSASDEVRSLVDAMEDGLFEAAGFSSLGIMLQMDYKLDNGNWHYTSEWDEGITPTDLSQGTDFWKGGYTSTNNYYNSVFTDIFPNGAMPGGRSYMDNHTMQFRIRYHVTYFDEINVRYHSYFSPWSAVVSYTNNQKVEDPAKLMNHVPVLKSVELKTRNEVEPYLEFISEKVHNDIQTLHAASNQRVHTNVWVRVNNGQWKDAGTYLFLIEKFHVDAKDYFDEKDNYDAAVFEVKFRYSFDYSYYPQAGRSGIVHSPFSNTISHGTPAFSGASTWAESDLKKAAEYGFITDRIKGNMSGPITREEFAEVLVKFHEKMTGKTAGYTDMNVFVDTKNPEIFKAYELGLVKGMDLEKKLYVPNNLITREQIATMMHRAAIAVNPDMDSSIEGVGKFPDEHLISGWALESVKFANKNGIMTGVSGGRIDPKGTTTREQAVIMIVRTYEKYK